MGSLLLAAGAKGRRYALPHSRILIHQLSGGFEGQAADIEIQAREALRQKEILNEILGASLRQEHQADREGHRPRQLHERGAGGGVRSYRRSDHGSHCQDALAVGRVHFKIHRKARRGLRLFFDHPFAGSRFLQ